ncbi:MFS transporter [Actinoplanes sp. NPDC049265]|uniref:MFS transporter n=1 Tax=Actinoplanes sp. NPDC049265 TaxID=3363902 RepID=UPI00371B9F89
MSGVYLSTVSRPAISKGGGVGANVLALGTVSLITDVSSEMITAILPVYLVLGLHLSPLAFGLLDGVYTGATAVLRVAGGFVADRVRARKFIAGVGYGLSAVMKLGLLLAGRSVGALGAVIAADRLGKGLRTAPRDALISLSTPPAALGRAFGVHRMMDSVGAFLGPLVALGVLFAAGDTAYDAVFVTSFCVAAFGVVVLVLFVREQPAPSQPAPASTPVSPAASVPLSPTPSASPSVPVSTTPAVPHSTTHSVPHSTTPSASPSVPVSTTPAVPVSTTHSVLHSTTPTVPVSTTPTVPHSTTPSVAPSAKPCAAGSGAPVRAVDALGLLRDPAARRLLLAAGLLGVATIGDGFVYLLLQRGSALEARWFPLLAVGTSLAYLVLAAPLGRLADRVGRLPVVAGGYLALAVTYLLLPGSGGGWVRLAVVLGCYGLFYAATDGVLMALSAPVLPERLRTTGLALVQTGQALAYLVSSVLFGAAWQLWGPDVAIRAAALLALMAVAGTFGLLRSGVETPGTQSKTTTPGTQSNHGETAEGGKR